MRAWPELPVASVPAYAARWLLAQGARGPVTAQTVRAEALRLRSDRRPDLASQLEMGWAQLRLASEAWAGAMDCAAVEAARAGSVSFVVETETAKPGPERAGSSADEVEVTTSEAAVRIGCSPQYVGRLLRAGALKGRRAGRVWLVEVASLEAARRGREAS